MAVDSLLRGLFVMALAKVGVEELERIDVDDGHPSLLALAGASLQNRPLPVLLASECTHGRERDAAMLFVLAPPKDGERRQVEEDLQLRRLARGRVKEGLGGVGNVRRGWKRRRISLTQSLECRRGGLGELVVPRSGVISSA